MVKWRFVCDICFRKLYWKKIPWMLNPVAHWQLGGTECDKLVNCPSTIPLSMQAVKHWLTFINNKKTFSLCWCAKMFTSDCTWAHFLHDSHFKVKSLFPDVARQPRNVSFCPLLHALIMAFMQNRLDLQLHLVVMEFVTCTALQSIPF